MERIGDAATRLNLLVDELLDLTQLEHASMGLRRTRVDLATLLASFTGDLGESPGMPPVHVAVPSDLPPVDADAQRIGHVLANLADNARKYGGDGPVTITRPAVPGHGRRHGAGHRARDRGRRADARVRPVLPRPRRRARATRAAAASACTCAAG